MVIPLTGFEPTMAMALAATVVKRKEIRATMRTPTRACHTLLTTPPRAKKAKTARRVRMMPKTTAFIEISFWVRSTATAASPGFFLNSATASPSADLMTPEDLMMPMIPAVAIPPIPIWRA